MEIYKTLSKLTTAQISEIRKSLRSRRLKIESTDQAFKLAGAGIHAKELKDALSSFDTSKEAAIFLKTYLDSTFTLNGVVFSSITGEEIETTYHL